MLHALLFMCHAALQRWIEEMSSFLKKADPNHMVTVGEEGFYGPGSPAEAANPGTGWATITGQNFSANHAPDSIDFAAIHLWPDNWEVTTFCTTTTVFHST